MFNKENPFRLRRFSLEDAATIITWPKSQIEVRWWTGPNASWPVPQAAVQCWHDDPDVRPYVLSNELTDEWQARGAQQGREYAILTNTISDGTFGLSIQAHKTYKLLPKNTNLRDHMTTLELALISLGEATATVLHRNRESQGYPALHHDIQDAGVAAGRARREIEQATGEPAVSSFNHLALLKPGAPLANTRTSDPQERSAPDVHQRSLFDEEPS